MRISGKMKELDEDATILMRNTFFIFKEKFYWNLERGLKCEGKGGFEILTS